MRRARSLREVRRSHSIDICTMRLPRRKAPRNDGLRDRQIKIQTSIKIKNTKNAFGRAQKCPPNADFLKNIKKSRIILKKALELKKEK